MSLLSVELRALGWLMLAMITVMLVAWTARFAPWLLLVPVPRLWRRLR